MVQPKTPALLGGSPDEVEAQFYEALQKADLEALMALWADDDEIVCVHPGGPRVVGPGAIRAAFEAIFSHNAIPVVPEQVHRLQWMGGAVHHLVERIEVMGEQGKQTAFVLATNVYVNTPAGWRLAAHHASPGALHEAPASAGEPHKTLH
jgi:uncharacterized protein (TIGR02246 family)